MFRAGTQSKRAVATTTPHLNDQSALIVDVRTAEEYASAHVPGARNIPVQELQHRHVELGDNKHRPIILYCRSGARSALAARTLAQLGFTAVKDIGAMSNWRA